MLPIITYLTINHLKFTLNEEQWGTITEHNNSEGRSNFFLKLRNVCYNIRILYADGFSICYQSAANNTGLNERFKKSLDKNNDT